MYCITNGNVLNYVHLQVIDGKRKSESTKATALKDLQRHTSKAFLSGCEGYLIVVVNSSYSCTVT